MEKEIRKKGYTFVCGVDEAGRGPLAGPVCAAAVVFEEGVTIEGINDSKKLSEKKREALFEVIKERALAYGIAFADVAEIEEYNILGATYLAMNRAIEQLGDKVDFALIDGNRVPKDIKVDCQTVVKGDAKSVSIAAASILAKVTRDRLLLDYDEKYPEYGFKKHKGYGTAEHMQAIREHGMCEVHRPSFLKKL
ncbi:MAG: ribonuclease HII [Acutalibacteraceae bacterium]|nr:ribonuclease HII [Acutalibacteraceae bacterium]